MQQKYVNLDDAYSVVRNNTWQEVTIPLNRFVEEGLELGSLINNVMFSVVSEDVTASGAAIEVDDIFFSKPGAAVKYFAFRPGFFIFFTIFSIITQRFLVLSYAMRLIPRQRFFILLFFLIGISSGAHSLAALKIVNYNAADGLANNHVLCVEEDSRGVLWVGTYSGVQIFDGYDFQIFNENKRGEELFTNHVVYAIAEDKNHNMWFGTEFGLNKYDVATGVITRIIKENDSELGPGHNHIRDIYIDDDGLIWLGTYGGGITIFDEKNKKYTH